MNYWFVFTEAELEAVSDGGHGNIVTDLRERGRWTDNDTLVVKSTGPQAFVLVGAYSKYPRRIGPDPPTNTLPSHTKLSEIA